MRTTHALLVACLLFATVATALADEGSPPREHDTAEDGNAGSTIGLGVAVGNPTGLLIEWAVTPDRFVIDLGVGFGFYDDHYGQSHLAATLDFIWLFRLAESEDGHLNFRVGIGAKVGLFYDDSAVDLGFRVPFGIDWRFHHTPIDLFLEVAPGMWFTRHSRFNVDAMLGITFWL